MQVVSPRIQPSLAPRWPVFAACLTLLACLFIATARAVAPDPATVLLNPAHPDVAVVGSLGWFGPSRVADIAGASSGVLPFAPRAGEQRLAFEGRRSLWLKLRLQRTVGSSDAWFLQVPVTIVDRVTLYQQDASGHWVGRSAGDLVPLRDWPQPGRYPTFPLHLRGEHPADVFVQVQHSADLKVPVRLVTAPEHEQRTHLEYLALGVVVGALALLLVSSLVRSVLLRDDAHAWYAVFTALAVLSVASFTGVASQFLWRNAPAWADVAPGCFTLLGSGLAAFLFGRLGQLALGDSSLGRMLRVLAFSGPVLAFVYAVVERPFGVWVLGVQPVLVAALALLASVRTHRRGDAVGLWMLLGAIPLLVSLLCSMLRVTGLLAPSWASEYVVVLALTLNLPMLLVALNSRTEVRRGVELRRLASANQDPLTGLSKRVPFLACLQQTVLRHRNTGESAAFAIVALRNFEWIRTTAGEEAAEEALLRTVIHLRRVVRDVDITGRLGESTFGLIIEGVAVREGVARIASRLIAASLMRDPQQPGEPELRIHMAAVMLNEHTATPEELTNELRGVLAGMSARTRRPFRFYDPAAVPVDTAHSPLAT